MPDGLEWRVELSYSGTIDPEVFFGHLSDREREKYWSDEVTEKIKDWCYGTAPAARASGYIMRYLDESIDDSAPMVHSHMGIKQHYSSGEPDWRDFTEIEPDSAIWAATVKAHPWVGRHPDDPPLENESVDPGGTAPLPLDIPAP